MQRLNLIFSIIAICFISQIVYGQEYQFMYGDSMRAYVVYEPSLEPNPKGYPLVIGLHGSGSDGYAFIGTASLVQKAIKEKFIVACPNGLRYNLLTWWNAGGLYEDITHGTDDIGFISALIDTMSQNYNVDTTRIYVMGFSNGAAMTYRVAAELSHKVAAMGVSSGQMLYEYCDPDFPVPIIHFHGLKDDLFPYYGAGEDTEAVPPVDTTIAIWREINKCSAVPDTILNKNGVIGKKWTSPGGISDVVLYTYEEGEHEWPRPANWGISATDIIWDFLKEHFRSNESANLEAKQFMYDGEMRTYLVYDPSPGSSVKGRPLVVGLHCHTGSAAGLLTYTDLIKKSKEENFIGVFPNGLFHPLVGTAWNAGGSFEQLTRGTDDIGFISALIDTMIKNYDVDTTRIYATGHSNGSMMSYRVAAELSHRIAAIGCVAAPMLYEYCDPEYPVPMVHFHGLSDTTLPYGGMEKDFVSVPPVDSTLLQWREINDCSPVPDTLINENGVLGQKWSASDGKSDVLLYTIETCQHDWPVFEKYGIDATDVIWDFFELHNRSLATGIKNEKTHFIPMEFQLYQNYPNPFNATTEIRYELLKREKAAPVTISIFNILGENIKTLVNKKHKPGSYSVLWDGQNDKGKEVASGIYVFRMTVGSYTQSKMMILQK